MEKIINKCKSALLVGAMAMLFFIAGSAQGYASSLPFEVYSWTQVNGQSGSVDYPGYNGYGYLLALIKANVNNLTSTTTVPNVGMLMLSGYVGDKERGRTDFWTCEGLSSKAYSRMTISSIPNVTTSNRWAYLATKVHLIGSCNLEIQTLQGNIVGPIVFQEVVTVVADIDTTVQNSSLGVGPFSGVPARISVQLIDKNNKLMPMGVNNGIDEEYSLTNTVAKPLCPYSTIVVAEKKP